MSNQNNEIREQKSGGITRSIVNIALMIFIIFIGASALLIINTYLGPYLTVQYWLLAIGIVGSLCTLTFLKHHRR